MTKIALLIGVSEYGTEVEAWPAAEQNVQALQQILTEPDSEFRQVLTLLNPDPQQMSEAIETVFAERHSEDIVLLYFCGAGFRDDSGKLYLATSITRRNEQRKLVKSSAVLVSFVQEMLKDSQAQQQLVILETSFSPTEAQLAHNASIDLATQLGGSGRLILSANTASSDYSQEHSGELSEYTRYLVEGLATGAADLDNDGMIAVNEWHEYATRRVQIATPAQQPGSYGEVGQLLLATVAAPKERKYRQEVERCTQTGEISIVGRSVLDVLGKTLGITPAVAAQIEAQVLAPHHEYQQKLQRYVQECVAALHHSYALSSEVRAHFQQLQHRLGLRDQDIAPIEAEIALQFRALQSLYKPAKDPVLAREELAISAPPMRYQELFVNYQTSIALEKNTQTNFAQIKKYLLLLGTVIAAAVLTIVGTNKLKYWQDDQRLKLIEASTQSRNYYECIAIVQTISQSSSLYREAQLFFDRCKAGVNWQRTKIQNLQGHSDRVWTVAYSVITPMVNNLTGQTLISGSSDNTIKIWNAGDGALLRTLKGHSGTVWSVAYSARTQTLVSGSSDRRIKLWNLSSGALLRTLRGHSGTVRAIALSPDGQTLISGSSDNTIKLWNLSSGALLRTLRGHSGTVRAIALSPDGQTLISGSSDNTIKLWNLSSGELRQTLFGHTSRVLAIALSSDGQTLVSGSVDQTIKIWNLGSGKLLRTLAGNPEWINSVAISPDGRTFAGSIGNKIKIWDLNTLVPLQTLSGSASDITSISFSTDGGGDR